MAKVRFVAVLVRTEQSKDGKKINIYKIKKKESVKSGIKEIKRIELP
jgi:hypothetical protein